MSEKKPRQLLTPLKEGEKNLKCSECGEQAAFIDNDFLVPVCGEECADKIFLNYIKACNLPE